MIIKDKLLEPYYMRVSDISCDLIKVGKTGKGEHKEDVVGYYSSVGGALKKAAKLKVLEGKERNTIKEYIEALNKWNKSFIKLMQ